MGAVFGPMECALTAHLNYLPNLSKGLEKKFCLFFISHGFGRKACSAVLRWTSLILPPKLHFSATFIVEKCNSVHAEVQVLSWRETLSHSLKAKLHGVGRSWLIFDQSHTVLYCYLRFNWILILLNIGEESYVQIHSWKTMTKYQWMGNYRWTEKGQKKGQKRHYDSR